MPTLKHIVNVWEQHKFDGTPWTSLCATCANEGQFVTHGEATTYANQHVSNCGVGEVLQNAPPAPVKASSKQPASTSSITPPAPPVKK
jgi:hypothetical protein